MYKFTRDSDFPQNGFEAWGGYGQAKIAKLEDQFSSKANKECQISSIFNGISIYVNGYTKPSSYELKALMVQHGGVYHTYQRSDDFIIASNLPDTKVKNQSLSRVVKPDWITESIEANRLLDYRNYLLYNESRTQPKLHFGKKGEMTFNYIKSEDPSISNITDSNADITVKSIDVQQTDFLINKKSPDLNSNSMVSKETTEFTKTAADPNFISEFYNNSRLHHISQLGACFKQLINDLRDSSDFTFPARLELKNQILNNLINTGSQLNFAGGRIIMHIDMDCFFVSVGIRGRQDLKGKPVAVTHARSGQQSHRKRPGTDREIEFNLYRKRIAKSLNKASGVAEDQELENVLETRIDNIMDEDSKYGSMSEIASCSYEARAKGISNGMFMGAALKLCPNLLTIQYDFDGYKEVAFTLYNTVAQYTLDIEAVSCDEMYVDCTELIKSLDINVPSFATTLRDEIKRKTGCPCSTGFGGNRLQARLATKCAKPDGQYFLTTDLVDDFMVDIKLRDLPGVGRQMSQKLEMLGHETCGSLQCQTLMILQKHFGNKTGSQLYDQCRGIDNHPLNFHTVRKSVSAEVNYGIRFENKEQCIQFLNQLSAEVHSRMNQFKVSGKCITLKLMVRAEEAPVETAKFMGHGFCNTINKSVTLPTATDDLNVINKEVLGICDKLKIDPKEMRGIGIQITKLEKIVSKHKTGAMNKFLIPKSEQPNDTASNLDSKKEDSILKNIKTTPKKDIHASPSKNKSPILGASKSPIKRRRMNLSPKFQASASSSIMNNFLHGNPGNSKEPSYCRTEAKSELSNIIKPAESEVKRENRLCDLPWKTIREMLRAWLNNSQPPLQCDVTFLVSYLTEMVVNKRTEKVQILLRFLGRKTEELGSYEWRNVYQQVLDEVQNVTFAMYGMKLHL